LLAQLDLGPALGQAVRLELRAEARPSAGLRRLHCPLRTFGRDCAPKWPIEDNLRRLAEETTTSNNARAFGLKAEDSYAYVKRVALRGEPLNAVLSPIEDAATLSFAITGHLLVSFSTDDRHWWEYLNRIEEATEAALAADLDLLPALMLRSRRLTSPGASDGAQR
jgi:hypothetical protein